MSIEKMLSHVYEIEGLMLVTRRLGDENTPEVITNKIQRKVRELAEMCGIEIQQPVSPAEPENKPEAADAESHLPEADYNADETWQHDNGEEFKEVFKLDYQEPQHETVGENKVPVEDREPDEDITVEFIEADDEPQEPEKTEPQEVPNIPQPPVFRAPEEPAAEPVATPVVEPAPAPVIEPNDEPVPEPDPAVVPESEMEPDITVEFILPEDEKMPEPEDEMPMPPVPTEFPEVENENVAPLRVDQKLQRNLSKDIRKAFSINDRFRFQRELFAGSADALNTAIEHIEVMTSYGNAELYFFSQLGWDRENEVVQDFMSIVRNHFQK